MHVKERILALRLIEKSEKHIEYFERIGVTATVKTNDTDVETQQNNGCRKAFGV